MSDLRPVGVPVMIEGVERHFLFTLNVMDEIQEHYDKSIEEIMNDLSDSRKCVPTLRYVVAAILNDEAERKPEKEYKKYTEKEIGWVVTQENLLEVEKALINAYIGSLPEPDEDDDPN